jgi:hypothetical protein
MLLLKLTMAVDDHRRRHDNALVGLANDRLSYLPERFLGE